MQALTRAEHSQQGSRNRAATVPAARLVVTTVAPEVRSHRSNPRTCRRCRTLRAQSFGTCDASFMISAVMYKTSGGEHLLHCVPELSALLIEAAIKTIALQHVGRRLLLADGCSCRIHWLRRSLHPLSPFFSVKSFYLASALFYIYLFWIASFF